MALKYTGTGIFKYGLEVQGLFPLDSRVVVVNASDLDNYKNLFVSGEVPTWYVGMEVFAEDTKQKYILISETEGFKPANSNITSDDINTMINNKLSSVYKFKGSKATYNSLPTEGNTSGDTYNIESEFTITKTITNADGSTEASNITYPAGTNVAWVASGDSGYWDPLGGTSDILNWIEVIDTNENLIGD